MNFAADVTDAALDSLPQDLPFAAFGRLIDALEQMLGNDPVAASCKIEHPADNSFTNGCRGGFQEDGRVYLFTALFYYGLDERIVYVWNIHLTEG